VKNKFAIIIALFVAFLSVSAKAQVSTGTPWMGSFTGGPDVINLGNLNVNWTIPLINKAGRGIPFTLAPTVDSSVWYPVTSNGTTSWHPRNSFGWGGLPGGSGGSLTYSVLTIGPESCGPPNNPPYQFTITQYQNYVYTDAHGTVHTFPSGLYTSTVSGNCYGGYIPYTPTPSFTASDGTGWTLNAVPGGGTVANASGIGVNPGTGGIPTYQEDANGNYIHCSSSSCTDTLNTTAMMIAGSAASPPMTFTVPGVSQPYTINYTNKTVQTAFNCGTTHEFGPTVEPLISSIVLPDGTQYQFTYEPTSTGSNNVTGRLLKITIPSDPNGPTITYAYSGGDSGTGIYCADGTTPTLTRTTPDGQWTYARSGSGTAWTTTVTAPPGSDGKQDQTLVAFWESGSNFYEIGREAFSGSTSSGTLLETTLTCYQTTTTGCPTTYASAVSNGGTNYSLSGRVVTNQFPGSAGISSGYSDLFNMDGLSSVHTTYDFGAAGTGTFSANPLQIHTTSYYIYSPGPYDTTTGVEFGDIDRIQFDYTVIGYSTPYQTLSYTQYNYGETNSVASGAPQRSNHICSTGSACPYDLTSVNKWVSGGDPIINGISGTTFQTMTYQNFDTGLVDVATDVNGGTTTYTYNGTGGCGDAFPTSVASTTGGAVSTLTTFATWNCNGGVQATSIDVNGNTTTYAYGSTDQFWRPTSITNNSTGAVTTYTYPTTTSKTLSATMNFNSSSSTSTSVTTYDRLGRAVLQQTKQGPSSSNYDSVASSFDQRGRAKFKTLPYQGTLGQSTLTGPGITTAYDALNRTSTVTDGGGGTVTYTYSGNDTLVAVGPAPTGENTKHRSLQYNGAGWLTSVCEIVTSTLPAGGACGQTVSHTGYLTNYTYNSAGWLTQVQQNAQPGSSGVQTRTVTYDGLGRKLSETIPEWSAGTGAAGTTTYSYDSASSCTGTYTGDLVKTVDNMGNTTCFTYDKLHRPTSSDVVSGTYATVTPLTYAVYDAATYSGTAMSNAKGALAEAYTCSTSACSSKLTDTYFSASPVTSGTMSGGVLAQMWESTPHSSGYFLTQDTYFPNGAVGAISASLGGLSIGIPALTFGLDGEGRPYSATDGTHSLSLVTATGYNAASLPTSITYGNLITGSANDVDSFSYDPNTFRPTNLTYSINPTTSPYTVTSALTWNANSSLQRLVYTDGNDSTKNQTCTYSADDLSRISSVNCSAAWAQTFAYDAFGNINKSGSSPYNAAYNTHTNQVSSMSPLPTYDANGNQKTSTPATLTWNALAQPITVNSTSATYDAMGRMVEKAVGSTYTQFVYRPSGAQLAVYSGSLVKATIPLPGGSTAVYNSTGVNFIRHKDWLGSSRLATTWSHTVYSKVAYAPFGETYNETGTAPDRSFTGQDQDLVTNPLGTGVYDFLFRKYDPSAGRWLSPDPAGWNAVNQAYPQSLNRYAYVRNNPMSLVDPLGLDACYYGDPNEVSVDRDPSDWGDSSPVDCALEGGQLLNMQQTTTVNANDSSCNPGDASNSSGCLAVQNAYVQYQFQLAPQETMNILALAGSISRQTKDARMLGSCTAAGALSLNPIPKVNDAIGIPSYPGVPYLTTAAAGVKGAPSVLGKIGNEFPSFAGATEALSGLASKVVPWLWVGSGVNAAVSTVECLAGTAPTNP